MTAGRPRKPLEQRELLSKGDGQQGGHKAPPSTEITPRDGAYIPVCPDQLGERGLTEWEKVWTAGWWLKEDQDYHWVVMLARAYDQIDEFAAKIAKDGLVVKGYNGQKTAHPLLKEMRDAERVVMKALSTLGFSPSDRARLGFKEAQAQNEIAKLQTRTRNNQGAH